MNATTASATTAQTTNAPRVQWIHIETRGDRRSEVHYPINSADGMKKARDYIKKKARQGYTAGRVYTFQSDYDRMIMGHITLIRADLYSFITPGYNEGHICSLYSSITRSFRNMDGLVWMPKIYINPPSIPVVIQYDAPIGPEPEPTPVKYHRYGVRTIKDGVVLEWETFATIEDARGYAEDDIIEGATESVIIGVNRDGSLGDIIETIRPEPTPINAIEECAKYCPTAQDAVKVAMLLNPCIRVVSNRSIAEIVVDENEIYARTRPNNQYVKGWCDLGVVSIELRNEGLLIWYVDDFDNATRDYFIPWDVVQTVTVLNTGRDIFKSVKGAN